MFFDRVNWKFLTNWSIESRQKYVSTRLSEMLVVDEQSVLQIILDGKKWWCEKNDLVLNDRKGKEI